MREFGDVDAAAQVGNSTSFTNEYVYFLQSDLSVRCYDSPEHKEAVRLAVLLTLLWPVGVQLLYVVLLLSCVSRYSIVRQIGSHTRPPSPPRLQAWPLHWEAIDFRRIVLLAGLPSCLKLAFYRIVIATLFSLAVLLFTLALDPYRHKNQILAIASRLCSLSSLLARVT